MAPNRYTLTKKAEEDLKNIRRYGLYEWGRTKSDSYLDAMERTFNQLVSMPFAGSEVDNLPLLRKWGYGSHIIFYTVEKPHISIKRVLGNRQEHYKHL